MTEILVGAGILVAAVGVLFVYLFFRLASPGRDARPSLEWCNQFSVGRFRPMERLFSEEDYRFLAAQPGYSPRISKRLRAERRRIFRHYLRCLSRDFQRLHTAARFLLLHSPVDRPDLVTALFRQRLVFQYAMLAVHWRLTLQALGLGSVDVRGLVAALDGMGDQFRQLAAATQRAAA